MYRKKYYKFIENDQEQSDHYNLLFRFSRDKNLSAFADAEIMTPIMDGDITIVHRSEWFMPSS